MIDVEKFLISLRNHKAPDGRLDPIHLADTVQEEIKIIQAAVENSRREWVGLTEKEVKAIANKRNDYGLPMTGRMWVFVADLTDKLKEKNHG